MKHLYVHATNKYPGFRVDSDNEKQVKVYDKDNNLVTMVIKDGAGNIQYDCKEFGAKEAFDLSPLPKNTTFIKMNEKGYICNDVNHQDKFVNAKKLANKFGKVPNNKEYNDFLEAEAKKAKINK